MSKNKVQLVIAGATYFLVTDETMGHLQKAATQVEELLLSFKTAVPDATKASVLVALELATQLVKLQEKQAAEREAQIRLN